MQQLERDLAHVLRDRAEDVTASAVTRVRAADYHPRVHRVTPRLTAGAIAGVVASSATVAAVVSVVGAPTAFAGWKASPGTGTANSISTAQATCSSRLGQQQPGSTSTNAVSWSPVVTDVRGPYTLVAYDGSTGEAEATCLVSATFTSVWQGKRSATGEETSSLVGVASREGGSGDVSMLVGGALGSGLAPVTELHADASGQGRYTLVQGQVPKTVATVTLGRSGGGVVQATTNDGWFVAWWPGTANATSAQLTSATGTTTTTLSFSAGPGPGPGGPCAANATTTPGSTTTTPVSTTTTPGSTATTPGSTAGGATVEAAGSTPQSARCSGDPGTTSGATTTT